MSEPIRSVDAHANGVLASWGIDFPAGTAQPRLFRFLLATVVAVLVSLAACAALVAIGTTVFPSTIGYEHFRFGDYAKLTIIGVVLASFGWPTTTFVSSRARKPYLVLAVLVSIVALAPDAWILYQGQSPLAVLVLVAMHVALAVITYASLVFIAPQRDQLAARPQ
jgi:hypothetical protein